MTRRGIGGGRADALAPPCEFTWAGSPTDPIWTVSVDGELVLDDTATVPPVAVGEVVQIVIEARAEGAEVGSIDVVRYDDSIAATGDEALERLAAAGGGCDD